MRKIASRLCMILALTVLAGCTPSRTNTQENKGAVVLSDSLDGYYDQNWLRKREAMFYNPTDSADPNDAISCYSFGVYNEEMTAADFENIAQMTWKQLKFTNMAEAETKQYQGLMSFAFYKEDGTELLDEFMYQQGKRLPSSDKDYFIDGETFSDQYDKVAPGDIN